MAELPYAPRRAKPPPRPPHCGTIWRVGLTFTIAEAAQILEPAMTEPQLHAIIRALGWKPDGHRHTGTGGRPPVTYDAARLLALHAALIPFLDGV